MRSNIATIATTALALFATSSLASVPVTVSSVVTQLNNFAEASASLRTIANKITAVDAALLQLGSGKFNNVVRGYQSLVTSIATEISSEALVPPITDTDSGNSIAAAFTGFVQAQQALLTTFNGKAALLNNIANNGAPIATVLTEFDTTVDNFALSLVTLFPASQTTVSAEQTVLDAALTDAVNIYSGTTSTKRSAKFRA